jgi:hypothetical protein
MKPASYSDPSTVAIDPQNPWLGLFSYSEETRGYFHGREEETAELARRVQRKLLTVLFGQSGLGKTSLLRAGIVPRLRDEGYCPVYVRVDYNPDSPAPAEQIKQAIFRASAAAGHWTRPGTAVEGESLWEFMHHRGDLLRDAAGRTLVPLLIFDQFEEVFTLAQADDRGRERAREFLAQLADLVENRPPAALEARLEDDDAAAQEFDFARADYRVLIALREDYLAHLESVKGAMPSITQNRMRLARMTGEQALAAVMKPGGRLVTEEVAESIVRFVAGGSELANAEIEPSLLSLVCRELNTARQAQGRAEISADLLAGSRETILGEFYERTLADQPPAVRRVIEDELLTDSGYRESLAEERVVRALAVAGAAPDALAKLVDRRLLRIEERLDVRRVELTHVVVCSVVLSSRDKRHEREARDAAEARLAEQKAREDAQHRALVRARQVAGVCAVLMLVAVAGAIFGWVNLQRARAADVAAQKARGDAEKLVGFLIEDFYAELEPTGRLATLGKLAHRTVAYYDGLPPDLRTPKTQTYRAMALIREGEALNGKGDLAQARKNFTEAAGVFERLRAGGDRSEGVTVGLAQAYYDIGTGGTGNAGRSDAEQLEKAIALVKPYIESPTGSRDAKLLYGNAMNFLSHTQRDRAQAVATCVEARRVMAAMGALDLTDLAAAAAYADIADSEARHLLDLDRVDEARVREQEVYELAEKVLAQRPNDLRSLANRFYATQLLGQLSERMLDPAAAEDYSRRAGQAGEDMVRFNPADLFSWQSWTGGYGQLSDLQVEHGRIAEGMATMREVLALGEDKRIPSSLGPLLWQRWQALALVQARAGDMAGAERSFKAYARGLEEFRETFPEGDPRRALFAEGPTLLRSRLNLLRGDSQEAYAMATRVIDRIDQVKLPENNQGMAVTRDNILRVALRHASRAALLTGRHAEAQAFGRRWLALPVDQNRAADSRTEPSRAHTVIAHSLAMQGQSAQARAELAPALAYLAEQQRAGAGGVSYRFDHAFALYVSALAAVGAAARNADLAAATRLLDGAPEEARNLADLRILRGMIDAARHG